MEEKPKQLTSYGLNNSKLTVKLTTSKVNEPLVLLIGGKNEHGFYAKTLPKKNVFTINQSLFDTLNNRKLVDFFNKSLVDFNDDDLAEVTLLMDDDSVDLTRDEKDLQKWTMVKPVNMKANTATINSLLFDLKNVRIVEFITTHTKNSKTFNFEQPEKEINLTFKNGKTWALKLGNQTSSQDHYFAQRSDDETVFTIQKSSVESIFRSLHDLKDRTVLMFDDDLVKESSLENDYTHQISESFTQDGKTVYRITSLPKPNAPVVWGKLEFLIYSDFIPLQQSFFDERGNVVKVMSYSDVRSMDDRKIPTRWRMVPQNKTDQFTEIVVKQLSFDRSMDEGLFSLRNLRNPK